MNITTEYNILDYFGEIVVKVYSQKRFSNKSRFSFRLGELLYSMENKDGAGTWTIPYENIPFNSSTFEGRSSYLSNIGLLFTGLGTLYFILYAFVYLVDSTMLTGVGSGMVFLPVGIIFLIAYKYFRTVHTLFETDEVNLLVIHDSEHDEIVRTIQKRRNKRFFELYGEINQNNDPQMEKDKFRWLLDRNVISEEIYDEKVALLDSPNSYIDIKGID